MTTQSRPESVGPELAALQTPEAQLIIGALASVAGWGVNLAERRLTEVLRAANHQPVALDRCKFARGLDGHRQCVTHDWEGFAEQLRRVTVCPAALAKEPSDG